MLTPISIARSGFIASGAVGWPHVASGHLRSGGTGNAAIVSGSIASGQVASGHLASGTILPNNITSGAVNSGKVASGAVQGFFGATRHVASGTVGVFDFGSGAVTAGTVGSGAVVSGNVASGQVGINHLQSGTVATQALLEAGASLTSFTTPGRQQFHPSAAKAWVTWGASGGTPTIGASYNVSSLTDGGVGIVTVNFTTAFSSENYAIVLGVQQNSGNVNIRANCVNESNPPTAGACQILCGVVGQATNWQLQDRLGNEAAFFGDQ